MSTPFPFRWNGIDPLLRCEMLLRLCDMGCRNYLCHLNRKGVCVWVWTVEDIEWKSRDGEIQLICIHLEFFSRWQQIKCWSGTIEGLLQFQQEYIYISSSKICKIIIQTCTCYHNETDAVHGKLSFWSLGEALYSTGCHVFFEKVYLRVPCHTSSGNPLYP